MGAPLLSTFYAIAEQDPDRLAVLAPDGRRATFGELSARANRLTHALHGLGLGAGDGVVAIVHNGLPYFELLLATLQAGIYFTPVNYRSSADEIAYVVGNSGARVVIADADIAKSCTEALDGLGIGADRRFAVGGADGWSDYSAWGASEPATAPENPTAGQTMLYTSGTTGRPKGVRRALSGQPPALHPIHRDLLALMEVRPGGVHLVPCPLYHAAPGSFAVNALHLGAGVVLMDKFDAEETLRLIQEHRVTDTHLVPTMFHRMLRLPEDVRAAYDTSSLTSVIHGAAPCPPEVKERMIAWLGPIVHEYYGASEGLICGVTATEWLAAPGTVGRALPGVRLKVLDDDGQTELPDGEPGSIYFSSSHTQLDYLGDPGKTAASRSGDFITVGDYGYRDAEGRVFLLDRRTDLILSGGVNIYPAEIEARLLSHPDVADAAVIGEPDDEWGQRVIAVVEPVPGASGDASLAARLEEHCRAALAGFKTPKRFDFVGKLPRTEAGKMLRRTLRQA